MNKAKKSAKLWILAVGLFASSLLLLQKPPVAFAAEPGCYSFDGFSYRRANCDANIRGGATTNCYVSRALNPGFSPFEQQDCDTFALEGEGQPLNPSSPPINTQNIETDCDSADLNPENCRILSYLQNGINFLSALAGLAMVFSLIWAGYQYMTARDNPSTVAAAKSRILWTLIALLLYIFMYAILNWIIPGGVLPT